MSLFKNINRQNLQLGLRAATVRWPFRRSFRRPFRLLACWTLIRRKRLRRAWIRPVLSWSWQSPACGLPWGSSQNVYAFQFVSISYKYFHILSFSKIQQYINVSGVLLCFFLSLPGPRFGQNLERVVKAGHINSLSALKASYDSEQLTWARSCKATEIAHLKEVAIRDQGKSGKSSFSSWHFQCWLFPCFYKITSI